MRSAMAAMISVGFELKGKTSEAEMEAMFEELLRQGEAPTPHPRRPAARFEAHPSGGGIFYVNEGAASRHTVFYLHGGAYMYDFAPFHWSFIGRIAEQSNATFIVPAYRLAPFATWEDAFELIAPAYERYVREHPEKKVVLMGDSSGGGLAAALAEQFALDGVRAPDELILISPWVDVTMENPAIADYAEADPWLHAPTLAVCGRRWAGALDPHDYRVSPIYGDAAGLRNVTLLIGTKDVLYPDSVKFFDMLARDGDNELVVAQDMMHVYPLMPIPEAKPARALICDKIARM